MVISSTSFKRRWFALFLQIDFILAFFITFYLLAAAAGGYWSRFLLSIRDLRDMHECARAILHFDNNCSSASVRARVRARGRACTNACFPL
jgi:hypothetical protein